MKEDIIESILITIITVIIFPFVSFGTGYILGWLIQITIGNLIVKGFATIGLNIAVNSLPLFFATISIIGSFFSPPEVYSNADY